MHIVDPTGRAVIKVVILYPEVYDLARFRAGRREFPPFGPLYLAAVAEDAGYEVEIRAVCETTGPLDLRGFDVVAFSLSSSATYGLMLHARRTACLATDALLLAGGVHANFFAEQTLLDFDVHAVGIGDGEETFLECLERVGELRRLAEVAGLCLPDGAGRTRRTVPRRSLRDVSHLPAPARHLLSTDSVIMSDRLADTDLRMAHVMFSRGCPFRCRFCAVGEMTGIAYRSGDSARQELEGLIAAYGIEGFAVVDDNFIINQRRVLDICDAVAPLGLRWSALSRVDRVDPGLLARLRAAGCIELKFGMESGSQRILTAMNKGRRATPQGIRDAVRDAHAAGIGVKLFIVHGFPGENRASTRETRRLLQELAPMVERVSLFRFVPLPGTYVYSHPEEFGLHGTDRDPDWDGDWSKYHIHHNDRHWWGDKRDWTELDAAYRELRAFVDTTWPDPHMELAA